MYKPEKTMYNQFNRGKGMDLMIYKETLQKLGFSHAEEIDKGWSVDKKYRVQTESGESFLLRITPREKSANRAELFRLQQAVASLDIPMCQPVAFGECEEGVYTVQTWIDGEDAKPVLPLMLDVEQYLYGMEAGRILRKIHTIPAPETQPDWAEYFNKKIDRKIAMCRACPIQFDGAEEMIAFIEENRHLLNGRPQCFQHGDYHIGNMMLENGKLTVIDFDRFDFGDPWEEFNRITWCAQAGEFFATGLINGYFENEEIPEAFWRLLALYIYTNMLSSVAWAIPYGQVEVDTMLQQIKDVLAWYEDVTRIVPTWYQGRPYIQWTDGVPYRLREPFDFGFLAEYGKVFKVYDDQDSGNICFGLEKDGKRCFLKFAGAPTARSGISAEEAINNLKPTAQIYRDLAHPNLIRLIDAGEMGGGYGMVFEWTNAVSLGRMYPAQRKRFLELPAEKRIQVFRDAVRFHSHVAEKGYAAVDFYDSTVMYDIEADRTVFCDIDFYQKAPFVNSMGRMWGSARFMSPEEFTLGAVIDETTNVYAVGALAFSLFADCSREAADWTLSPALYAVAKKATADDRNERYATHAELLEAWDAAMQEETGRVLQ